MPSDDKFADAVRPALEALLSDLQHTTEVLRRANLSDRYGGSQDLEPIYQEQTQRVDAPSSAARDLDSVNNLIQTYNSQRASRDSYAEVPGDYANTSQHRLSGEVTSPSEKRVTAEGGGARRPTVQSLFSQLEAPGSKRSLGASQHDMRRSPSRDPSQADTLLGTMRSDYSSQHGINTIPKGDCALCAKPIIGQVVIALGNMWHPEHFSCCECSQELGHRNFFERNGKAYCEEDYHNMFSPRCAGCNGAVKDHCVTALGKNFHIQCFVCNECGVEFGDDGFHEKDGRAYCRRDFFRMFAPKCSGCHNAITQNFVTALGTHWHPDCFVCQMCHESFEGGSFFDHQGVPLCERHYHEKRGSLCAECRQPITGRCVSAIGLKFHPEHFRCTYCARQLTKGTFKEVNRKPFCHKCYSTTQAL